MVDISKFLARAEDAFKKRNYQYSIQMYLEALQVAPENIEARKKLRMVLLQANKDGVKVPVPIGRTLVLSRDPKVQIVEHEKAVVKDPRSLKYNMRVGDALVQLGYHESAANIYQYVVDFCDKGKENLDALKKGARAYIESQIPDSAQKLLTRARALAPTDKEVMDLARNTAAATTLSRISAAKSSRQLLKNSTEAAELELLNRRVLNKDELRKALEMVQVKIDEKPSDKNWIKKKAELYVKGKQYDAAYKWLIAKSEELDHAPDLIELGVRYKNQDFELKLRICAKKAKEEPAKAADWSAKAGKIIAARSKFQIEEYQRQVDEAPADLDARHRLGGALFNANQHKKAVGHLQRAVKSPKLGKRVGILLGRCFTEMKRFELAEKQLKIVHGVVSDAEEELYNDVRYWLANVYDQQSKKDDAIKLFQELFLDNADYRDVGERLDKLQGRA